MQPAPTQGRERVAADAARSTHPPRPIPVIYTVVWRAPLRDKHVGAAAFATGGAPVDAQKSPEIAAPAPSKKRASCGLLLAPGIGDSTTVYVAGRRSIVIQEQAGHRGPSCPRRTRPWRVQRNAGAAAHSGTGGASLGAGTADVRRGSQPSGCRVVPPLVVRHRRPAGLLRRLPRQPSPDKFVGGTEGPDTTAGRESGVPCATRHPPRPCDARAGRGTPGPRPFSYRSTSNIRENLITNERSVRCGRSKRS